MPALLDALKARLAATGAEEVAPFVDVATLLPHSLRVLVVVVGATPVQLAPQATGCRWCVLAGGPRLDGTPNADTVGIGAKGATWGTDAFPLPPEGFQTLPALANIGELYAFGTPGDVVRVLYAD